eukprot:jgi/Hompol1/5333/HPOL_001943-RA
MHHDAAKRQGNSNATSNGSAVVLTRIKNIAKVPKAKDRSKKDEETLPVVADPSLEASWVALQRKTKLYEQMRKQAGTDDDADNPDILVDFLRKTDTEVGEEALDLLSKAQKPEAKWVQVFDEFGRARLVRESEAIGFIRAGEGSQTSSGKLESADMRREQERREWEEAVKEETLNRHYDNNLERRAMGVGFYQFSHDEDKRKAQIEELKNMRKDTLLTRQQAQEVREKRKSRIQDRRALLQARLQKRQKSESIGDTATRNSGDSDGDDVDEFLRNLDSSATQ